MRSLLLNTETWDLCLNGAGQIMVTDGPYCIAQNVANAIRLFTDDAWFDPQKGVPHFMIELGKRKPSVAVLRNRLRKEAMKVQGVINAEVIISDITDRTVNGDIRLILEGDATAEVSF